MNRKINVTMCDPSTGEVIYNSIHRMVQQRPRCQVETYLRSVLDSYIRGLQDGRDLVLQIQVEQVKSLKPFEIF